MTLIEEAGSLAPDRQVRVMIVDDHEIMRDGLREVLQRYRGLTKWLARPAMVSQR